MTEEHNRPNPDELLNRIKEEEEVKERKKGYLKIFLGYVAGVGKTYRMLSEARILKGKEQDVVVGLAETHGMVVFYLMNLMLLQYWRESLNLLW